MPMRMKMRWTAYVGVSTALAGGVVLKALAQRPNFYSATVYLSQSSANLMIITNMVFAVSCTFVLGLQKLLYGPLRPIEVEQLYEKAWFAVTETCLAMTIFRGEIGAWFLTMFFALLVGKVWGWIGEGRVEVLEQQPPRNPRLFHSRLALSLGLSVAFDLTMLEYVVKQVMRMARPDMMVMFGFEFAVLSIMSLSTAAKYAINLIEIGIVREQKRRRAEEMKKERVEAATREIQEAERGLTEIDQVRTESTQNGHEQQSSPTVPSIEAAREALRLAHEPVDENEIEVEGWDNKGRWIFYLDLMTDLFKLIVYLSFFFILLIFYGLPIHIMRDVFLTFRSFLKRISDFIKYRAATRDMNERYPDATANEIGQEDVCIICREELRPYEPPVVQEGQRQPAPNPVAERMRAKKLPCGHILHFSCLRSWLERQQVCPTCRASVVPSRQGNTGQVGAQGGRPDQGQHPGADRPAPRVYQLGPLRIGVGAHRGGNMFEELQQQLGDGRAGAPPQANANGPQQYGFGIRWEGGRRRPSRRNNPSIREQLDEVQRQISQEINDLGHASGELVFLRQMQLQLDRMRLQRENLQAANASAAPPAPAASVAPSITMNANAATILGQGRSSRLSGLASDPEDTLIEAGSDRMPQGVTLPEGWTLMPLRSARVPPPPHMPDMPAFNRTSVSQTMWAPGLPAPVQIPPGMFQMPEVNGQNQANTRTEGQIPPPTQNGVNSIPGLHNPTSSGTTTSPMNPENQQLHNHLAIHEAYLASLRNPAPSNNDAQPSNPTNGDPTSNGETSTDMGASASPSIESMFTSTRPATNATPLPQWGTSSTPSAERIPSENHTQPNGNIGSHREEAESLSSSEPRPKNNRSATVEDLVEDPD